MKGVVVCPRRSRSRCSRSPAARVGHADAPANCGLPGQGAALDRLRRARRADRPEAGDDPRRLVRHRSMPGRDARRGRGDDLLRPAPERPRRHDRRRRPTPRRSPAKAKQRVRLRRAGHRLRDPLIAENELFGAQTPTPWSATNAQYRANVLQPAAGARRRSARRPRSRSRTRRTPAATRPTGGARRRRRRSSSARSTSPRRARRASTRSAPTRASRSMRKGMRGLISRFGAIGIPAGRVALELQFQSAAGQGGRKGCSRSRRGSRS